MLFGRPPFSVVFKELMLWMKECVEEAHPSDAAYPGKVTLILTVILTYSFLVMVAHNGFGFDFLFLLAEIQRRQFLEAYNTVDLWFAYTLFEARTVSSTSN